MMKLFGGGGSDKNKDKHGTGPSREQVREMVNKMRREERALDREIVAIDRKETELKIEIKKTVKQGHPEAAKALAKNVVQARKAKARMYTAKAQMESVALQMQQSAAAARLATGMQASTEVMKTMQSLISVPETAAIARELSKEMMKMGIMEEMMDDVLGDVVGISAEEEDLADEEVAKVLAELTQGILEKAPVAPAHKVSVPAAPQPAQAETVAVEEDAEEEESMRQRLEALRS